MFFVYLLPHRIEPRFKIGKANEIHQRIVDLGGHSQFKLEAALCVAFETERQAYRIERVLHRLFHKWNIEIAEGQVRVDGDTEQFAIECFDRVVKFLTENRDITHGSPPREPPERPVTLRPGREVASPVDVEERKRRARVELMAEMTEAMEEIEAGLNDLLALDLRECCVYADAPPDDDGVQDHYLRIAGDRGAVDQAYEILTHWRTLLFSPSGHPGESASLIGGIRFTSDGGSHAIIEANLLPLAPFRCAFYRRGRPAFSIIETPEYLPRIEATLNRFPRSDQPRAREACPVSATRP